MNLFEMTSGLLINLKGVELIPSAQTTSVFKRTKNTTDFIKRQTKRRSEEGKERGVNPVKRRMQTFQQLEAL
jgi:hypothetical protein